MGKFLRGFFGMNLFGGIFSEELLEEIVWEDFFGKNFREEFFVYIDKVR